MSSSDSEDENIKRYLEAADTTLINDGMFQDPAPSLVIRENQKKGAIAELKSNRYVVEDENVFQSDINVSESMKKFIGNKLAALIDQKVAFVELKSSQSSSNTVSDTFGVKLLRGCDQYLKIPEIDSTVIERRPRKAIKKTHD